MDIRKEYIGELRSILANRNWNRLAKIVRKLNNYEIAYCLENSDELVQFFIKKKMEDNNEKSEEFNAKTEEFLKYEIEKIFTADKNIRYIVIYPPNRGTGSRIQFYNEVDEDKSWLDRYNSYHEREERDSKLKMDLASFIGTFHRHIADNHKVNVYERNVSETSNNTFVKFARTTITKPQTRHTPIWESAMNYLATTIQERVDEEVLEDLLKGLK